MGKQRCPHTQDDLFDAGPAPAARDLDIRARGAEPLGEEQNAFNRLVRQLQGLRGRLEQWRAFEPRHERRIAEEMLPVREAYLAEQRRLILLIESLLEGRAGAGAGVPGKAERKSLRSYLMELVVTHLDEHPDDTGIIAVHDRFADTSFAEEQANELRMTRDMAEEMFGVELDDEVLDGTVEDILAAGMDKAQQAASGRGQREREHASDPRVAAREARKAAAAEAVKTAASQSVREVFRKLASALHPDRAPDEAERERRHGLMQRANVAYEAGDLLGLLTLQLEIEQIDAGHLARVPAARVEHYNAVLREQVRELEAELDFIRSRYAMLLDLPPSRVTIEAAEKGFAKALSGAKREIRELKELHGVLLQPAARKRWLRGYAEVRRAEAALDAQEDEAFLRAAFEHGFAGTDPFGDIDEPDRSRPPRSRRNAPRGRRRS